MSEAEDHLRADFSSLFKKNSKKLSATDGRVSQKLSFKCKMIIVNKLPGTDCDPFPTPTENSLITCEVLMDASRVFGKC